MANKKITLRYDEYIRIESIETLLQAQKIAADKADVDGCIKLSKYISKLSQQLSEKTIEIWFKEYKNNADQPPEKCE